MGKTFAIINDQAVDVTGKSVPKEFNGLTHIFGKKTPEDRRYVMKVDPTLVKEKIRGKEAENLGREPVLVYDVATPGWSKMFDTLMMNGVCFGLGFTIGVFLYYSKIIEVFTK